MHHYAFRHNTTNKGQSNLAVGGIGSGPQVSPSRGDRVPQGDRVPCLIQCYTWEHTSVPTKWHLIPSNGFCWVHEYTHRLTGYATVTGVAMGAFRSPNNYNNEKRCMIVVSEALAVDGVSLRVLSRHLLGNSPNVSSSPSVH